MYTSVHSDVSRESSSFELFNLPLDVPLERKINQGYMAYVYGLCIHMDTWLMYSMYNVNIYFLAEEKAYI